MPRNESTTLIAFRPVEKLNPALGPTLQSVVSGSPVRADSDARFGEHRGTSGESLSHMLFQRSIVLYRLPLKVSISCLT